MSYYTGSQADSVPLFSTVPGGTSDLEVGDSYDDEEPEFDTSDTCSIVSCLIECEQSRAAVCLTKSFWLKVVKVLMPGMLFAALIAIIIWLGVTRDNSSACPPV